MSLYNLYNCNFRFSFFQHTHRHDSGKVDTMLTAEANEKFPMAVIDFYEKKVIWSNKNRTDGNKIGKLSIKFSEMNVTSPTKKFKMTPKIGFARGLKPKEILGATDDSGGHMCFLMAWFVIVVSALF